MSYLNLVRRQDYSEETLHEAGILPKITSPASFAHFVFFYQNGNGNPEYAPAFAFIPKGNGTFEFVHNLGRIQV